jgi:hypothetical protein
MQGFEPCPPGWKPGVQPSTPHPQRKRSAGLEPAPPSWQPGTLPLCYDRELGQVVRIELTCADSQSAASIHSAIPTTMHLCDKAPGPDGWSGGLVGLSVLKALQVEPTTGVAAGRRIHSPRMGVRVVHTWLISPCVGDRCSCFQNVSSHAHNLVPSRLHVFIPGDGVACRHTGQCAKPTVPEREEHSEILATFVAF